jgi:3-oxoacyl-[acyl-carrier protein] reductase
MSKTHGGRVAVVTGAGRGIGRAIATLLAERGASLVLVDVFEPKETATLIDGDCLSVVADVSSDAGWAEIASATIGKFGRADIVVNNAALMAIVHIDQLTFADWKAIFSVNLDAHFLSAKHFIPLMRQNKWGRFVNISSNSIGVPQQGMSHYMATKMGVIGFVRGLANDLGADGITVNAILPGITNTPATAAVPEAFKREVWMQQAIKRFGDPEDIAGPVVFLTGDDAAFMTGQAVVVDGGMYKIS